jgi:uncharacterized membrane protein
VNSVDLGGGESKLETAISYLLIIGVVASLALEVVGIALFYHSYGHLHIAEDKAMFISGQNFFDFLHGLFRRNYVQKTATLLMTVGIALLIVTPYLRVIMSVLYFIWKRDIKYALITIFVLAVLTISLGFR